MSGMVINNMTLAININLSVPNDAEKKAGIEGPKRPPTLAPAAITPKSRPACSFEKSSDIKLQNTEI